jgi:signal transduction histidine kinase
VTSSLRLRLIAAAAIWVSVGLIVSGILITRLLQDFIESSFDARLAATLVAVMGAVEFRDDGGMALARPVTEPQFEQVFSGWYWQIADGNEILIGSRSLWNTDLGIAAGATTGALQLEALVGPNDELLRAMRRDFSLPESDRMLRVTVTAPLREIEAALSTIVTTIVWSLTLLGLGLIGAVLAQVHFGLRPLDRVRQNLAEIRRGRLTLLPDEPHIEISPLVREFNALIDHNGKVIERTRTHVRNLAHSMKTPLSVLSNEIAKPGRDPDGVLAGCVEAMQRQIRYHLRRGGAAVSHNLLHARTEVAPVIADLSTAMRSLHRARRLDIVHNVAGNLVFAGDQQDLEEMLGNLMDNACKWAKSQVAISCARCDGMLTITIADDGPGMGDHQATIDLAEGPCLDQAAGNGLGLGIVQDIARLYGGRLTLGRARIGGLEARLILPAIEEA